MIQVEDKIISIEVFRQHFLCDISKCKGICCYEGDSGAPLEENETAILDTIYPIIRDYLPAKAQKTIEEQGTWVVDRDGDYVTPLVNNHECAYAIKDKGTYICAIEKAFSEGKLKSASDVSVLNFPKPISCHLYPIRVKKYRDFEALNYHQWDVCKCAKILGEKEGIPVYKFLKAPLIRKYGEAFYNELEKIDREVGADLAKIVLK